jgi:hypothetical protein
VVERYVLVKDLLVAVPIYFGGTRENKLESKFPLQLQNVASSNYVSLPKSIIVLFTIDPAEFRGQVIDVIEATLKYPLQLAVVRHVRAGVLLVGVMLEIATPDLVSAGPELRHEVTS